MTQIGVQTMKRQTSMIKIFSLYSPDDSYDEVFLSNYAKINIEPRILRIAGVGEAFTLGADYSMRIWLKPDIMAQYKLIPSDIIGMLAEQNIEAATGTLGENSDNAFQYTMKYSGRKATPEEFEQFVIAALPSGEVLRLKDVADIELGSESYAYKGYTNGHPGVSTMVFQTAGSNATQVVNDIDALLEEVRADLPKGVDIAHLHSVNDFLYASINEVLKTLIEAIILVVLVVYVFLQDIRSTLIPTVSILVALIGTFAFLSVAGFSINLLTLFALVLAIGTVVDDAIIVVEAVQARFDAGYKSSLHGHHRRHVGHHVGHRHLDAGLHGRVHPRGHDGRHVGRLLHAVRYYDGRGRRPLGRQRPHAVAGALRPDSQALHGRERRDAR